MIDQNYVDLIKKSLLMSLITDNQVPIDVVKKNLRCEPTAVKIIDQWVEEMVEGGLQLADSPVLGKVLRRVIV